MRPRDGISRGRNPYVPPGARAPARARATGGLAILWWILLAAPFVLSLLVFGASWALNALGNPVSEGFRRGFIQISGLWVSASVRAAFLFPSAWILERIVRRLRPDSARSRALALPITIVALYVLSAAEALTDFGYVPLEHPLVGAVKFTAGLAVLAAVPLLLIWVIVAVRARRS
jgi:hypothetical protein